MTTSTSRLAYDDIFELLDRAVADGVGVRIKFDKRSNIYENFGEAIQFRVRIHTARQIDRKDNAALYPREHPLHGRSQYDIYRASIRTESEEVYIYLEKRSLDRLKIEDLTQLVPIEPPAKSERVEYTYEAPKLIESPTKFVRRV